MELSYCKDHKAYYVALSRGFPAEGTIIVQKIDKSRISSMSGYLRQELRELEILDEITRLRCEGKPPPSVEGLYRHRLIQSYYAWKSDRRDPVNIHPEIRWNPDKGTRVPDDVQCCEQKPSIKGGLKRKRNVVLEDATHSIPSNSKHAPAIMRKANASAISSGVESSEKL